MYDLISRQAAIDALGEEPLVWMEKEDEYGQGLNNQWHYDVNALKAVPSAQQWIPVTTRPMDEEERKQFSEVLGFDVEYADPVIFECEMPDDGQEILVSYNGYIGMDKCEVDDDCYYGLEGNGDWYGVTAWMPLPKPYQEGADNGTDKG